MNRITLYAVIAGALVVSATAVGLSATYDAPRSLMDRNEYSQARRAIETDARLNLSKCRDVEATAREICKAEARADERMRKADLEAHYRGTVAAAAGARLEHAKARYEIAKARCDDRSGTEKLACLRAARSDKAKALAEARQASPT